MKFLQTKPQVKYMKISYYDLYYTVVKKRDDEEIVNDEEKEIEYINCDDSITPNHYFGRKNDNMILKWRKIRSQINHFK